MRFADKYNNLVTGIVSGLLLPVIAVLIMWIFSSGNQSLHSYFTRIINAEITTHIITLSVFPNLFIFLLFNRLDMLYASRGVLSITIAWAIVVFIVKFT
jgi:hypothetical protein